MKKIEKKKRGRQCAAVIFSVLVVLGLILMIQPSENSVVLRHSQAELQARYDYLLSHIAPTNVHPFLRAVHFSIGNNFAACGTMVLKSDGTPFQIVTANHLFSETQPGSDYYDYHVLGPANFPVQGHVSEVVLDSMRTSNSVEGIQDIAFCHLGKPALISRTAKGIVSAARPHYQMFEVGKISPIKVRSITTGEQFTVVGQIVNNDANVFFVMLYESMNGESGSGFWAEEGKLFVLSGGVVIGPEMRRDLEIPAQYQSVSILSGVALKW